MLDAFRKAKALIDSSGPYPVAIWVVDRPDMLYKIRNMCKGAAPDTAIPMSVPVYEWSNIGADPESYHRAPWFVRVPGVWAQMSDYQHKRMV